MHPRIQRVPLRLRSLPPVSHFTLPLQGCTCCRPLNHHSLFCLCCRAAQVTLDLCYKAAVTEPLFLSLNNVDANNKPTGYGTADLKRTNFTVTDLSACTTPTSTFYRTFDFSYQLAPCTKYALSVGTYSSTTQVNWGRLDVTPTPSSYYVALWYTSNGGSSWSDSSSVKNPMRIEFVCAS